MGRPSKFDRDEAVDVVMNAIWRNGYEASSVKALSEQLGITRSSFYNAFTSREALFREVLERYCDQSPDKALTEAKQGIAIKALLTRTFRNACKARSADTEGRGCMVINSVSEFCNVHDELGDLMEGVVLGSLGNLERLLHRGVAQGEIDEKRDIHATALALQNLLMGLNIMCKVVRSEAELWSAAETTLSGLGLLEDNNTRQTGN